ncbi:hypothetical protein QSH46_015940 [Xanthomonas arboricola pv. juglandis]|uniref:hypothetical protein n=1 Tax=Xanthomonas arboricola TaxID=56448 RepID=UPI000315FC8B|nr:hypothetical protein [Xanthomonas arboricola]MDN0221556.1 hypothetical protein [Xanthomonas arboricola pv. juglandis]MDN0225830.1 hypothetical protein [Xanthomonas arboricola pv. juglandis]MDN0230022.1 hypothetical protein [Xanthomonas arboricola pv. juglandis]MDN0234312.1 hypothetical protein [Xanthomonas arboricola pv. juglandis]MDN0238609.1 hypothetical protein [Xanthomonas arboricola pv. juglandis]
MATAGKELRQHGFQRVHFRRLIVVAWHSTRCSGAPEYVRLVAIAGAALLVLLIYRQTIHGKPNAEA